MVHQSAYYKKALTEAHTPFMHHCILKCDSGGLNYTIEDHDITLNIPEGAVAYNQIIHIEIGVTMYGHFEFPKNSQPISPIIWLCLLEDDIKLKKTFQLILPHFLTGLTRDELKNHQVGLVKAIHSNVEDDEMRQYKFNPCTDSNLLLTSIRERSYAALELLHCCFYCLKANRTPELLMDTGFCLTRIEHSASPHRDEVFFAATYFLKTCIQVLKKECIRHNI